MGLVRLSIFVIFFTFVNLSFVDKTLPAFTAPIVKIVATSIGDSFTYCNAPFPKPLNVPSWSAR